MTWSELVKLVRGEPIEKKYTITEINKAFYAVFNKTIADNLWEWFVEELNNEEEDKRDTKR